MKTLRNLNSARSCPSGYIGILHNKLTAANERRTLTTCAPENSVILPNNFPNHGRYLHASLASRPDVAVLPSKPDKLQPELPVRMRLSFLLLTTGTHFMDMKLIYSCGPR